MPSDFPRNIHFGFTKEVGGVWYFSLLPRFGLLAVRLAGFPNPVPGRRARTTTSGTV